MSRTKRRLVGYHRNIRTHQELAANEAAEKEGFRVRGNRKKKLLPNSWDDPRNSAVKQCVIRQHGARGSKRRFLVNVKGKPDLPW